MNYNLGMGVYLTLTQIEAEMMRYADCDIIIKRVTDDDLQKMYEEVLFYKYTPLETDRLLGD